MAMGMWYCKNCGKKTCCKCCEDEHTGKIIEARPHDWWRVEVKLYDGTLLAIEPDMLSGKSDLTERDLETIRLVGAHLLGFAVKGEDSLSGFLYACECGGTLSKNTLEGCYECDKCSFIAEIDDPT